MKLHELLRAGIDALKEFEQRDNCVVDMGVWTSPSRNDEPCFACLGGAYYLRQKTLHPTDSRMSILNRAITIEEAILDHLRIGYVSLAVQDAGKGSEGDPEYTHLDRAVADYHEDRDQFYEDMETLYTDLKNEDL